MKGEVKTVEIKCPKCGHVQLVESGVKNCDCKQQSASSVITIEDSESLPQSRKVVKNKRRIG